MRRFVFALVSAPNPIAVTPHCAHLRAQNILACSCESNACLMSEAATKFSAFVPEAEQCAQSLALRLLVQPGLMTPQLIATFGAVEAQEVVWEPQGQKLLRQARIVQVQSGQSILHARLCITASNLPAQMIRQLHDTAALFGQLLLDYQIAVLVAQPQIFRTPDGCFGRRTTMTAATTAAPICEVEETMAYDDDLVSLASMAVLQP